MVTITVPTAGSPPNESVGGGETCSFLLPVSSIIGQLSASGVCCPQRRTCFDHFGGIAVLSLSRVWSVGMDATEFGER